MAAMLASAVPHLLAVKAVTITTNDFPRKRTAPVQMPPVGSPSFDLILYQLKGIGINDGRMRVLDIVLGNLALIFLMVLERKSTA